MSPRTLLFIFATAMLLQGVLVAARHHHRKRADIEEYEYRDLDEYDNGGIFIDAVPVKTTEHPKMIKHYKTNRLPKMRRFHGGSKTDFFH